MSTPHSSKASRRDFLRSSAVVAGAGLVSNLTFAGHVHAAGSDVLKVGLVGCGGRGTGAAAQALNADSNVNLWAMGDAFADQVRSSLNTLRKDSGISSKIDVAPERCFSGFDAYQQVIGSGIDVVLLATPPHFRPLHFKAAVEAGKHAFVEKPVAVDGPGVRAVLAASALAKAKNLAVVSGLCWRYHHGKRETLKRVLDGSIGDIVAMQCTFNTHGLWHKERDPKWSDMEYQVRNWLYYTWLSGDHNVEQHIHSLDKMAWAMRDDYPVRAHGVGGRQARTDPKYGNIFDHHAVVYEFRNGVKCFSCCRQQDGTKLIDVTDYIMGTKGTADVMKHQITGAIPWRMPKSDETDDMYQNEHNELFASIRSGKPINNGDYMAKSTLMAIMGRMATYTSELITWDMALNSREDLSPAKYEWGPLPFAPVAKPGVTKFV